MFVTPYLRFRKTIKTTIGKPPFDRIDVFYSSAEGKFVARDDAGNPVRFDAGPGGGGSGDVSVSGTPTAGQAAEWTDAATIKGTAVTGTGSFVKATSPTLVTPNLGTPTALTLTNATGLPLSGIAGLGVNVANALAEDVGTDSSFVLFNGALGTPSSGNLANCTFPTLNQNTTGSAASLSISGQTGLLSFTGLTSTSRIKTVRDAADTILELGGSYTTTGTWTNLTMVTPVLGTPQSGTLTNCTGLPVGGIAAASKSLGGNGSSDSGKLLLFGSNGEATGFFLIAKDNLQPEQTTITKTTVVFSDGTNTGSLGYTTLSGNRSWTLPNASGTVSLIANTETLSNKTLVTPVVTTSITGSGALAISSGGSNTNLTLSGIGTGIVNIGSPSSAAQALLTGNGLAIRSSAAVSTVIESSLTSASTAGALVGLYSNDGAAMASGDRLGGFFFGGSSSASDLRASGLIAGFATEAWGTSSWGTELQFQTTANGGTTRSTKMTLGQSGILSLTGGVASSSTTTGTVVVTGGVGMSGSLNVGGSITATSNIAGSYFETTGAGVLFGFPTSTVLSIAPTGKLAWAQSGNAAGTLDFSLSRNAAGVGQFGDGGTNANGSVLLTNLTASGYVKSGSFTVGTLPAAATAGAGGRAFVTDANATTFLSTVAGGGANKVPVVSDGTNWLIG